MPPRRVSGATAAAVGVAAAAMVATLPGRTHGLGLITEPLLADLELGRVPYAALNFWATLVGAAFCIPVGWAIDRLGVRFVLAGVLLALGAVVVAMTGVAALLVVREPSAPVGEVLAEPDGTNGEVAERSLTPGAALRTPAFWVFALATSFYGLVSSALTLFNESLLAERGFDRDVYLKL